MPLKFRSPRALAALLVLLATVPASADAPGLPPTPGGRRATWADHRLMGKCWPTPRDFVVALLGAAALEDENIHTDPAKPLRDGSTWVVDQTPTTNYDWYLLQPGAGGQLCMTLFVPSASDVTLSKRGSALEARSGAQGDPSVAVRFVRPRGSERFQPVACVEQRSSEDRRRWLRRTVPCADVFGSRQEGGSP